MSIYGDFNLTINQKINLKSQLRYTSVLEKKPLYRVVNRLCTTDYMESTIQSAMIAPIRTHALILKKLQDGHRGIKLSSQITD